jgi:hypothetical protein
VLPDELALLNLPAGRVSRPGRAWQESGLLRFLNVDKIAIRQSRPWGEGQHRLAEAVTMRSQ